MTKIKCDNEGCNKDFDPQGLKIHKNICISRPKELRSFSTNDIDRMKKVAVYYFPHPDRPLKCPHCPGWFNFVGLPHHQTSCQTQTPEWKAGVATCFKLMQAGTILPQPSLLSVKTNAGLPDKVKQALQRRRERQELRHNERQELRHNERYGLSVGRANGLSIRPVEQVQARPLSNGRTISLEVVMAEDTFLTALLEHLVRHPGAGEVRGVSRK